MFFSDSVVLVNIAAITKFKHGDFWKALSEANITSTKLAELCGVTVSAITSVLNLNRRPSEKLANKIQLELGKLGVFVDVLECWPETFIGLKRGHKRVDFADIDFLEIGSCREALQIAESSITSESISDEAAAAICLEIEKLPKRHGAVLRMRFFEGKTLDETGARLRVTRERIRQMEAKAIRMLRNTTRAGRLQNERKPI